VLCRPGEINQVLLNLIVNAAHAVEAHNGATERSDDLGRITIATAGLANGVEIRVSDTGTGIRPEHRDRIFDPFFTTKAPGKGTGQGLTICQTIVAKTHRGTIRVESEPGRGATFIVTLPLDPTWTDAAPEIAAA
jgi:two-component system NtrC family sensor kinase